MQPHRRHKTLRDMENLNSSELTADGSSQRRDLFPETRKHRSKRCRAVDLGGYKVVSVRLREPEFECFTENARAVGLTANMALRIAARRMAGFLETDAETRRLLQEITDNIGEISVNIAQLNRAAARGGTVDMERFAKQRNAFGHEFVRLDGLLRIILNVSQRRRDGRTMLQEAQ